MKATEALIKAGALPPGAARTRMRQPAAMKAMKAMKVTIAMQAMKALEK